MIRSIWPQAACDACVACPSRKLLVCYPLFGFLGLFLLWIVSGGSFVGSGFVVGMVLVVYVALKLLEFGWKGLRQLRGDRLSQACLTLHLVFLALVALAIPLSYVRAQSIAGLVAKLHDEIPLKGAAIIPALIAKGESATDPLIDAMKDSLAHDSWYGKTNAAASAAYCLGKLGGDKASAYLGEVVRKQVDFKEIHDWTWQRSTCFAYGESAGAKAAPDLIALYQRSTGENPERQRWAILSALVRTRSRQGVEFVFDHMDVLLERAESGGDSRESKAAKATVVALFTRKDLVALKSIRYGTVSGLREEAREGEAVPDIRQTWATLGEQIRKQWMSVLSDEVRGAVQ